MTGRLPLCPRAPLESVYTAAVKAGEGGAVALHTAPYAVDIIDGTAQPGRTITREELDGLLTKEGATLSRSARYGSSYVMYTAPLENRTTVVWYETEADIAQKVELCQLLGIKTVYIE